MNIGKILKSQINFIMLIIKLSGGDWVEKIYEYHISGFYLIGVEVKELQVLVQVISLKWSRLLTDSIFLIL